MNMTSSGAPVLDRLLAWVGFSAESPGMADNALLPPGMAPPANRMHLCSDAFRECGVG